jgi:hypothetical protein
MQIQNGSLSYNYSVNIINKWLKRLHRKKKVREFPIPSRDVTTKLSLGGNNDIITELFLPRGSLVSDVPAIDGKLMNGVSHKMDLTFDDMYG